MWLGNHKVAQHVGGERSRSAYFSSPLAHPPSPPGPLFLPDHTRFVFLQGGEC